MEEICRICLDNAPQIHSVSILYKVSVNKTVSEVISECAGIKILEEDMLPKYLCLTCYQKLIGFNEFRQLIITSDTHLQEKLLYIAPSQDGFDHEDSDSSLDLNNAAKMLTSKLVETLNKNDHDNKQLLNEIPLFVKNEDLIESQNFNKRETNSKRIENTELGVQPRLGEIESKTTKTQIVLTPGRKPSKNCKGKRKVHEFKCDICKKILFGRSNRLEQHIITAHSDIRKYGCNSCHKKFKSKQQLANHIRVHTGEKPYCCYVCQETFTSPQNLFNHKKKHTGAHKSYQCDLCDKGYATPGELETHKRIVHTGEKPFLCEICSRAYSSVRNLGLHIRSVHEKNEKCPTCDRMLSIQRLKQHIQKHQDREKGIRRYTCEKCGKGFFSSHALKKHQVVHTGERPYSCEICNKSFSQKAAVDTHMRTHSDIRSFCCEICAKTYKYKQHLHLHMMKTHKDFERKDTVLNRNSAFSINT